MWRSILLVWRLLRQNWRRTLFIWRLIGNIGRQTSESRRQVMSLEVVQLTLEARKALLLGRRGLGDLLVASRRTVQRWDSCPPAAMTGALRPPSPPAHLTDAAVCAAAEGLNPSIARAMVRIAREETSHAQLSWDLAAWAEPRLTRAARTRVAHARSRAFEELCIDVDRDVPPVLVMLAGLPPRASARELLRRVGRDVIAARAA